MPKDTTPGKPTTRRYSPEAKAAAVRMVRTLRTELGTEHGTVQRVARQLGYGTESVRSWVQQADIDEGGATGATTSDTTRLRELEQEVRELRRASEILKRAASFYDYGLGVLTFSPVANVRRPRVSYDSSTTAPNGDELVRFLDVADTGSPRLPALATLLAYNELRIDEALSADVDDYRHQAPRVLRIVRKGGKTSTEPLAAPVVRALDRYLEQRPPAPASPPDGGPLFINNTGDRLAYLTAYRIVRRLVRRAGLRRPDRSPRTACGTFVTEALAAGAPLQDVQDAAGHAEPRTIRRYDRTRKSHDPTSKLVGHLPSD